MVILFQQQHNYFLFILKYKQNIIIIMFSIILAFQEYCFYHLTVILFFQVDQRNPQTAVQTSSDTPISAKPPAASKDVVAEIRQGVKSEGVLTHKLPL